jgi:hypothetical protein
MNILIRVKGVLLMAYAVQGFIFLSLISVLVLSLSGVVYPQIRLLHVPIFYIVNAFACAISFNYALGKTLKEAYPEFYKEMLDVYPITKIILTFPENATADFVRSVKKYVFLAWLIYPVLFLQAILLAAIILVSA